MFENNIRNERPRIKDLGLKIGLLPSGESNSITDVPNVKVGHSTIIVGSGELEIGAGPIRTGVTAILPHDGNLYKQKVTAATHIINGFGKSIGLVQINELGSIESPILLTNTINAWSVADAVVDYLSSNNKGIYSFNPIVGECNDNYLNDILGRHVKPHHVINAISSAYSPNIEEGSIGAGTGMTCFGWKGGIGTSSRLGECPDGKYTIGILVLTNTGDPRELRIAGKLVGDSLIPSDVTSEAPGSIIIVLATDAPVTSRQLSRIASRASFGLARTGGIASHSSGDFVIAFSNAETRPSISDAHLTPLFRAAIEATEEAIINSILRATTIVGRDGNIRHEIPIDQLINILNKE
ncbi:MAG: aminopeptidase [Chloroflexi bacterium]|nr:aminopeptidase [Chloroflexota bacterium]|tara:strand:+ start:10905 stop:11963 length:1059 start_codon:yes stop_codon:yes gene_type:complete